MRIGYWKKLLLVVGASLAGLGAWPATAALASPARGPQPFRCGGGEIAPGVYSSLLVSGVCYVSVGDVTVLGNVTVLPGALLDDITPGDPTSGTPVVPATVNVGGSVYVGGGAALLLGCSPNITCTGPPGISYGRIDGDLVAVGAQGVVVHSLSIGGSVTVIGGGGGSAADSCNAQTPGSPTVTNLEPWSEDPTLDYTPVYTDFEDVSVQGDLQVSGLNTCWIGTFRNEVGGRATFVANRAGDPDAMEVSSNVIDGSMVCSDDTPAVQYGDGGGAPNVVYGAAVGQCAFGVTPVNPAAEAGEGSGIPEHITVPGRSLQTFRGSYVPTVAATEPIAASTSAGDQITAVLENFTLKGSGLTGTGTFDPTQPLGSTGGAFLVTSYPDGSEAYTGYLSCQCRLGGQSGWISIRVYGTTARSGYSSGTFLITSGGGPEPGSLSTLAGWGSFNNIGTSDGAVNLVEHLAIT